MKDPIKTIYSKRLLKEFLSELLVAAGGSASQKDKHQRHCNSDGVVVRGRRAAFDAPVVAEEAWIVLGMPVALSEGPLCRT